jgi:hypothetical protein
MHHAVRADVEWLVAELPHHRHPALALLENVAVGAASRRECFRQTELHCRRHVARCTICRRPLNGRSSHRNPPGIGGFASKTRLDAMPIEITENRGVNREGAGRIETRSPGEDVSTEHESKPPQMIPPPGRQATRKRKLLMGVLGALVLAAAGVFGIPWIRLSLTIPFRRMTHM